MHTRIIQLIEQDMTSSTMASIKEYLLDLQERISGNVQQHDPAIALQEDEWQRPGGGGGRTRAYSQGAVFEKAGVNFSHVWGDKLPAAATAQRPELNHCTFEAMGLSAIFHPINPFVPTCHVNVRVFNATTVDGKSVWWFGGGFDLTPYYGFIEDCVHWHQMAKAACEPFGLDVYPRYKEWADQYFYLKHRQEPRGIGGIFFDDLNEWSFETCFTFMRSVGDHFIEAYFPIVSKRKHCTYSDKQKEFQLYRRGRYVEYNLLYDRGTLFGLQSNGRTESILVSLPPLVMWQYDYQPVEGSLEAELYHFYLKPQDWVTMQIPVKAAS